MKIACAYHSIDLDGWMSAAIVERWFSNSNLTFPDMVNIGTEDFPVHIYNTSTLTMIGYNYGDPIPDLSGYDKVIMCGVSFPKDIMYWLISNKQFIWIDHHVSALIENDTIWKQRALAHTRPSHPEGLRDTKFATCELTWKYFFHDEEMPEIVRLLGRYDCFRHKGTDEEQEY